MEKSLLEKAKEVTVIRYSQPVIDEEKIELALAWARGEITLSQASKVTRTNNAYPTLARGLKAYILDQEK